MAAGSTLQLTASPKDQNGNAIAATISWSSNATSVATVSNSGLVTGVAAGSAVITAASGSISSSATITVTVTPVLTTIAISGGTSVVAGSTLQLTASPKDQNGNAMAATITWSSNAPSVATVSGSGLVTGVAAGSATITAASGSVSGSASITVTVTPVLTTIIISGGTTVVAGSTLQLTASPKDQNGDPIAATISWSSNATSVATVNSSGLVTGVAAGSANIKATSGLVNASVGVTVTAPVYPLSATVNATISSTFAPATIDIARTGTITWAFSSVTHDVTFTSPGAPANIPATANTSISRVFNTAGTFGYQCTIHAGMTGVVIVH